MRIALAVLLLALSCDSIWASVQQPTHFLSTQAYNQRQGFGAQINELVDKIKVFGRTLRHTQLQQHQGKHDELVGASNLLALPIISCGMQQLYWAVFFGSLMVFFFAIFRFISAASTNLQVPSRFRTYQCRLSGLVSKYRKLRLETVKQAIDHVMDEVQGYKEEVADSEDNLIPMGKLGIAALVVALVSLGWVFADWEASVRCFAIN
eukprot:c8705_g1_i1.p1 GENE.c8705_g1_i1~~c8705_g1_i1.p1  ORF type:complete len:207 (-),score=47.62 c8705_g1_i1:154-774(-)